MERLVAANARLSEWSGCLVEGNEYYVLASQVLMCTAQ